MAAADVLAAVVQVTRDAAGEAGFSIFQETMLTTSVRPASAAYHDGLRDDCLVYAVDGQRVTSFEGYKRLAYGKPVFHLTVVCVRACVAPPCCLRACRTCSPAQ